MIIAAVSRHPAMIMNGQSTAIEFQGAGFRLPDGRALLTGLDLSIARGETLGLLGRSGPGKPTTLKLITRLLAPTEGRVLVDGKPTTAWDPIRLRRRIGYRSEEHTSELQSLAYLVCRLL